MTRTEQSHRPCVVRETYVIARTRRASYDGMGGTERDWHALVTRQSDGKQAVVIRKWRWLFERALRTESLDKTFRRLDACEGENEPVTYSVESHGRLNRG